MRPTLFLDIDGVLNSAQFVGFEKNCSFCEGMCWFDPKAVARLNLIIERTSAQIVISSSWRVGRGVLELTAILHGHGIVGDVAGFTPELFEDLPPNEWCKNPCKRSERGHEIQGYLDAHPDVTVFAIVDDDSDMAHLEHRFVKTSWQGGLLDEHVGRLCSLLSVV